MLSRRHFAGAAAALALPSSFAIGQGLTKVSFGTNWVAEAEHGGHYQALVDGTYAKFGLDVTIVPGGPQANNRMAMTLGKLDFYMGANLIQAFSAAERDVPTAVVAALFQKDPFCMMVHPGHPAASLGDLRTAESVFMSRDSVATYFQWMKAAHGFRDEQLKAYTFNPQPFIANKASVMQGYVSSEPFVVEQAGGFKPKIFLLADAGFDSYSTTIEVRRETMDKRRDVVQRFVDASIIGWYNYMYGDPSAAHAYIKTQNPEMTDAIMENARAQMAAYHIVDSGDSREHGIGMMTPARIEKVYRQLVQAGLFKSGLGYDKVFDYSFVGRKVGLELRKN